nr:hypothetical protein [Candidatus Electrothrix aestuarii]
MDCKRFIQKTFEFMKSDSRSLSWRERLVQSFGKDPLTCPNCKEKMFLWRIWHPDYGDIFDLSRDRPFVESKSKQECNKRNSSGRQVKWIPQLLPF